MKNMRIFLLVLLCVLICSFTGSGQNTRLTEDLSGKFKKFSLNRLNSKTELDKVKAGKSITINADGKRLILSLVENDLRAANYRQIARTPNGSVEVP